MPGRPLVFLLALTTGDYLMWNWSLGGSHGVVALISGLMFPPLVVACLWLLAVSVWRMIAARTAPYPAQRGRARGRGGRGGGRRAGDRGRERGRFPDGKPATTGSSSSGASSGKIAA